jgi:hypothetical protein
MRRYVFAIDTPSRRYYVEADNQLEFDSWVDAIQSAIRGKVHLLLLHQENGPSLHFLTYAFVCVCRVSCVVCRVSCVVCRVSCVVCVVCRAVNNR